MNGGFDETVQGFDLDAWLDENVNRAKPADEDALPPIVQAGAEVLRTKAHHVPEGLLGTKSLDKLVAHMVETMRRAPGVGLAAPQIGVPLRLFVAEDRESYMARASTEERARRGRRPLPLLVAVNPELTLLSPPTEDEGATFFEGCLSVRGYGALVTRASRVRLEARDAKGKPLRLEVEGWPARIFQHETDHLDGTLYVDRMITRSFVCDAELARWNGAPVEEVMHRLVAPPR